MRLSIGSSSFKTTASIPGVVLAECAMLFFRWQHPYCTILDRDAFWLDFYSTPKCGESCSQGLLYAICALGSLMSQDPNIKELADLFSHAAEQAVTASPFWIPEIATSQAMLLCAIFETGKGQFSKAWMFSGSYCNRCPQVVANPPRHGLSNGTRSRS